MIIEQVQHELLETPVTVYNFEVEGFHTYYVTESCILDVSNRRGEKVREVTFDGRKIWPDGPKNKNK